MQQVARFVIVNMDGLEKLVMPSLQAGVDDGFEVNNNDNLKHMAFPLLRVCLMLAAPASIPPLDPTCAYYAVLRHHLHLYIAPLACDAALMAATGGDALAQ